MLWSFYLPNTSLQGYTECLALYEGEPIPHMVRIEDDKVDTKNNAHRYAINPHHHPPQNPIQSRPIDIRLWTRNGEIQSWHRCISPKYDFYKDGAS